MTTLEHESEEERKARKFPVARSCLKTNLVEVFMITTVEEAVEKLNEVNWRDRSDWFQCPYGSSYRVVVMESGEILKGDPLLEYDSVWGDSYDPDCAIRIARSYELEEELARFRTVLKEISKEKSCDGPGCYWCDEADWLPHPATHGAILAANTFAKLK
jgi:hypothetical protein